MGHHMFFIRNCLNANEVMLGDALREDSCKAQKELHCTGLSCLDSTESFLCVDSMWGVRTERKTTHEEWSVEGLCCGYPR